MSVVSCDIVAWDSVGTGVFSHLVYLYRDSAGQYLKRDVIALQDDPAEVVYDMVRPIDDEEAEATYASLSKTVERPEAAASH
jgi:hypothetical protein